MTGRGERGREVRGRGEEIGRGRELAGPNLACTKKGDCKAFISKGNSCFYF